MQSVGSAFPDGTDGIWSVLDELVAIFCLVTVSIRKWLSVVQKMNFPQHSEIRPEGTFRTSAWCYDRRFMDSIMFVCQRVT